MAIDRWRKSNESVLNNDTDYNEWKGITIILPVFESAYTDTYIKLSKNTAKVFKSVEMDKGQSWPSDTRDTTASYCTGIVEIHEI